MWTFLIFVTAIIITALATSHVSAKRTREAEERARKERKKAHFALEAELLTKGPGEVWSNQAPDAALRSLRSLGNVGYLVWLFNCEPLYRDHRGQGADQYPPDWEWRRRFVFLRDRHKCQGHRCAAGSSSSLGSGLDCHHIKPISEFGPDEKGIHALSNLVTLCPICHASQHPGNTMLVGRAAKSSSREQTWSQNSSGRRFTRHPKLSSPGQFSAPRKIEIHSPLPGQPELSADEPDRTEKEYPRENPAGAQINALSGPGNPPSRGSITTKEQQDARTAKSITEGLAIVDERSRAVDNGRREEAETKNPRRSKWKLSLHTDPLGAVSLDWDRFDAGKQEEAATSEVARLGLQLEDLEKRLKETPFFKTFERGVIQFQIDNLKNRIRADCGVKGPAEKGNSELTKQEV